MEGGVGPGAEASLVAGAMSRTEARDGGGSDESAGVG